jgi:hypothetical protein
VVAPSLTACIGPTSQRDVVSCSARENQLEVNRLVLSKQNQYQHLPGKISQLVGTTVSPEGTYLVNTKQIVAIDLKVSGYWALLCHLLESRTKNTSTAS